MDFYCLPEIETEIGPFLRRGAFPKGLCISRAIRVPGGLRPARPRPGVEDKAGPPRSGGSRRPLRGDFSMCLYPRGDGGGVVVRGEVSSLVVFLRRLAVVARCVVSGSISGKQAKPVSGLAERRPGASARMRVKSASGPRERRHPVAASPVGGNDAGVVNATSWSHQTLARC
jgi:hypothetical protein